MEPVNGVKSVHLLSAPEPSGALELLLRFYDDVNRILANGSLALVRGWRPTSLTEFSVASFEAAGCSQNQTVCSHGELKQCLLYRCIDYYLDMWLRIVNGATKPFKLHTLEDLINHADSPDTCQNLLELTPNRLEIPFWLP
jgi:hypothetical protein